MDHSMHQQHEQGGPSPMHNDPEGTHADHH
jgi:hypothetical protein